MVIRVYNSCGVSLNRTHGIIFSVPLIEEAGKSVTELTESCIQSFIFNVNTFQWDDVNSCLVSIGIVYNTKLSCTSYTTKNYHL